MTKLERLDLCFNGEDFKIKYRDLKPTLDRLKHLSLNGHHLSKMDIETVLHNVGSKLTHLRLGSPITDLESAITFNHNLASITHLSLNQFKDVKLIVKIYQKFSNLVYLNLDLVKDVCESVNLIQLILYFEKFNIFIYYLT